MSRFHAVLITLVLLVGLWVVSRRQPPLREAGPFPPPTQTELHTALQLHAPPGYQIVATDEYIVEAEILSRRAYRSGDASDLSPVDFVLGWGSLTREPQLSDIRYSQYGRWYEYRWGRDLTIPSVEIPLCSANTHIIPDPGDSVLAEQLVGLRRGDCVRLRGYLVQVSGAGGWRWVSSRTRSDRGAGSCEVLYVTGLDYLL